MSFGGKVIVLGGETSSFWKGFRGEAAAPTRKNRSHPQPAQDASQVGAAASPRSYLTILSYKRRGRRSYRDKCQGRSAGLGAKRNQTTHQCT